MFHACTVAANNSKSVVIVSEISYDHLSAEYALEDLRSLMSSHQYTEYSNLKITFSCENFLHINLFMVRILAYKNWSQRNIS